MIYLYKLIITILYPFLVIIIFYRKFIGKEDKSRYKEKIFPSFFKAENKDKKKLIWFHAASIGEVQSIFPLIKKLISNDKDLKILVTTVTISSGKLVENKISHLQNISHRYFPLDVNFLSKAFLEIWKPDAICFVDSEIWPNFILNIKEKKIPLAIINGRITLKTFKRWMLIPSTAKKIFQCFNFSLSSNKETNDYLKKLGVNNTDYIGNLKFCEEIDSNKIENVNENLFKSKNIWCAASTHPGEEEFCVKTHLKLKEYKKEILTLIIPRHVRRSSKIKKICDKNNLNSQILNKDEIIDKENEIVIVNSFGALSSFFKYTKSVFVGKSIIKELAAVGGQSPIAAAKLGCKIYHGPFVYNFREIYDFLRTNKISKEISNYNELTKFLIQDFEDIEKNTSQVIFEMNKIGEKILKLTSDKISGMYK